MQTNRYALLDMDKNLLSFVAIVRAYSSVFHQDYFLAISGVKALPS